MKIEIGGTYKHVRRGGHYEVIGRARMQIGWDSIDANRPELSKNVAERLEAQTFVLYRSTEDDTLWCRPESEFCDGRFVKEGD